MKNILLSIDFSKHAYNAAIYAAELAKHTNTRLILFHAYNPVEPEEDIDQKLLATERQVQMKLDSLALKLQALTGISVTRLLKPGRLVEETLYVAKRIKADLILFGVEKVTPQIYKYLDKQVLQLIRKSCIPIMLVPSTTVFQPYEQVLLPTDNFDLQHDPVNQKFLNKLFYRFRGVKFLSVKEISKQEDPVVKDEMMPVAAGDDFLSDDITYNQQTYTHLHHPQLFMASNALASEIANTFTSEELKQIETVPLLLLPDTYVLL